jgi:methylamine utilization protein MauE
MFSLRSLAVPFSAAAMVLAVSGLAKLRRPGSLVRMLRGIGIPVGPVVVRLFAGLELALGTACLVSPGRATAAALGLLYLSFAAFLASFLARGIELQSCGCAGDRDLPPSWIHVGLNLAAAVVAALVAASTGPAFEGVARTAEGLPLTGVGFVAGVATLSWLAVLCAAYLPTVLFAYRGRP